MTQSQRPRPIAPAPLRSLRHPSNDIDISTMLADLHQHPGIYASADIYGYYKSICAENNRTPLPINQLGRKLKAWGYQDTRNADRTIRCWIIPINNH